MKKVLVIMAVALVLAWSASAMAALKVVSINFYNNDGYGATNTLVASDSAGSVAATNWNNLSISKNSEVTLSNLVDDSGTGTGLNAAASPGYAANGTELVSGTGADVMMMSGAGFESINPSTPRYAQLLVSGSTDGVYTTMGAAYDVIVYIGSGYNNTGGVMGSFGNILLSADGYTSGVDNDYPSSPLMTAGYRTLNSASTGSAGVPTYSTSTGWVLSNNATAGNYVLFTGVTAETLVITPQFTGGGTWFPTVNVLGIQIVATIVDPEPPVPEPAGLGLLGVALLALKRRRS